MKMNAYTIDSTLSGHFKTLQEQLRGWRQTLNLHHCVNLGTTFLPAGLRDTLHKEARWLLAHSERRDVTIDSTGGTPRRYRSVGRDSVAEHGVVTPGLFRSESLLSALSLIAGEPVFRVPYAPEEFIINNQSGSGDTHGWHWDDYSYALIHVVEAPNSLVGGRVEFVANVPWDKSASETCIRRALETRVVNGLHIDSGETYFMKTNTTLHRISPLLGDSSRIAIVYSFASEADLVDPTIDHTTMEAIYPKDTAQLAVGSDAVEA